MIDFDCYKQDTWLTKKTTVFRKYIIRNIYAYCMRFDDVPMHLWLNPPHPITSVYVLSVGLVLYLKLKEDNYFTGEKFASLLPVDAIFILPFIAMFMERLLFPWVNAYANDRYSTGYTSWTLFLYPAPLKTSVIHYM